MLHTGRRFGITAECCLLNASLRAILERHTNWKTLAMLSIIDKAKDTAAVAARLYKNVSDLAGFLEHFYGPENASRVAHLLKEHCRLTLDLFAEIDEVSSPKVKDICYRWQENAESICRFLHELNPFLDCDELLAVLSEHLSLIEACALYRIQENYEKQTMMFDLLAIQAQDIADILTDALKDQFIEFTLDPAAGSRDLAALN